MVDISDLTLEQNAVNYMSQKCHNVPKITKHYA